MTKIQDNKIGPDIPEPTAQEIEQIMQVAEDIYDSILPKSEAKKLFRLMKELVWWDMVSDENIKSKSTTLSLAMELQAMLKVVQSQEISISETIEDVEILNDLVPFNEKRRVTEEIKSLIIEHRLIPRELAIEEKTRQILYYLYGLEISHNMLEQLIWLMARNLWSMEGLDSSMEEFLDDVILFVQKREKGESLGSINRHNDVMKAFDESISILISS